MTVDTSWSAAKRLIRAVVLSPVPVGISLAFVNAVLDISDLDDDPVIGFSSVETAVVDKVGVIPGR